MRSEGNTECLQAETATFLNHLIKELMYRVRQPFSKTESHAVRFSRVGKSRGQKTSARCEGGTTGHRILAQRGWEAPPEATSSLGDGKIGGLPLSDLNRGEIQATLLKERANRACPVFSTLPPLPQSAQRLWCLQTSLTAFFSASGYDIFQRDPVSNVMSTQPKLESGTAWKPTLRQGCFYLLVFIPITCALLQLLSWSQFNLRGRRLQAVKAQRQVLTRGHSREIKMI